jgi:hypothetical protein
MAKYLGWLLAIIVVVTGVLYGFHLRRNSQMLRGDAARKAADRPVPSVRPGSLSEPGYVLSVKQERQVKKGTQTLDWIVSIPANDRTFDCEYVSGYADFKKGDPISFVHDVNSTDEAEGGYIVGVRGEEKNQVAKVNTTDLGDVQLDIPAKK